VAHLDLSKDAATLTAVLVDIASVSGDEQEIADAVEAALRPYEHLEVIRIGHSVVARTHLGRGERVVIAGHLDTVPIADNFPSKLDDGVLYGIGTADMKGGVAVGLRLAATVPVAVRDVTYVFYECEEVEAERNGLKLITDERPDLLVADFAVLMEPTSANLEGGCQGTMRVEVATSGVRAHAARGWMGSNAIHAAAGILDRLVAYEPREPVVDGLRFRESLNAVGIEGGVAGNVIPDRCVVTVNHRFAPDRDERAAYANLREFFDGYETTLMDSAPGARPGLDLPAAASFVAAVGGEPGPKFGWTDVARFAELGIAAVNYGPGNPNVAHARHEHVAVAEIQQCEDKMRDWLTAG
jgi:succinyl-diaminopimelate desuccinylase